MFLPLFKYNGSLLDYADDSFKDDKEIVFAAVKNNPEALEFASDRLKNDREIVFESVSRVGWTYCYTGEKLLDDKELLMAGLKVSGQILYFATQQLRDDKEVVTAAVTNKPIIVKYASKRLLSDLDIAKLVLSKNKKCYEFLDDSIKDNEEIINIMKEEGIEFVTGADIGNNYKASRLLKEYDSVILACGASNPRDINVPGREAKGIYFAVDFLKKTTKSLLDSNFEDGNFISAKGKNVLVIGGGDTGNDCVGTSIRLGAQNVIQLEMMPKAPDQRAESNPWPEWPKILKTDYGQQEAIAVFGQDPRIYETTVKEFVKDKDGNVVKAKCVKLDWKKDPKTGRMNMSEIEGSEYEVPCDIVLIAAGFLGSQEYVSKAFGVELNERTNVKTEAGCYATNVPKVFTAGDMHRGQSLVVWAIREGREVARAVDTALMGYSNL